MAKLWRVFAGAYTWAGIILVGAWPTAAQDTRVGVEVGYQYIWAENAASPQGVSAALATAITDRFALVGEGAWSRDSITPFGIKGRTTAVQAGGGVRWTITPARRLQPYAQVLAGGGRDRIAFVEWGSSAEWNTFVQPGAGIAVRMGARQSLLGQVDLREVFPRGGSRGNQIRLLVGVRLTLR